MIGRQYILDRQTIADTNKIPTNRTHAELGTRHRSRSTEH